MIFHLLLALLILVGPFLAITPATLAARCNGPVFTSRRPVPVYARTAVFA